MRDFNTLCRELRKNLSLCGEVNGTIYWYEGTVDLLDELLSYVRGEMYRNNSTEKADTKEVAE